MCKHHARGLEALFYLKYVNTCQLWMLSIGSVFPLQGKKQCSSKVCILIIQKSPIVVLRIWFFFFVPSEFYVVRIGWKSSLQVKVMALLVQWPGDKRLQIDKVRVRKSGCKTLGTILAGE